MKLLIAFLKDKTREISLYAGTVGIFIVVAFLYNIRMDALKYALLLVILWLLLYVITEYHRFRKKHLLLERFKKSTQECTKELPECRNLLELDYQELLGIFDEKILELKSEARIKGQDLSDYYGMWVHQIKTPIAGLQLLLQMERGEQENAESGERMTEEYHIKQLQNLTDMEEELFRIEEYVGMALQYQRLNSNSNDYILKQISLDTVIREVIHKYARIMIRRKIRLHYEKTNVSVISDEKWLAFVLEQLLSNAVKYTPGGELTIEVQEEPQQIWLKIRDTGIGIRSEDIPRVFEKGYTGFNGHEDKRSTGIGLYLCRDALQKLGHTIRIQSEIGEGTVVTVGFYKDTIDVRD